MRKPPLKGSLLQAILQPTARAIIDCVVPANELPNLPHLESELIENYAKAKLKEEILAFTGG